MATDTQSFKTVATFTEKVQADMCVALLGDNGIPAGVFGADSSYPSLAFARAIDKMHKRGVNGCKTVFDIAPADLSPLSPEELRAHML